MEKKYGYIDSDTAYLLLSDDTLKPYNITSNDVVNFCKTANNEVVYNALLDLQSNVIEEAFSEGGMFTLSISVNEDNKMYLITHRESMSSLPPEIVEAMTNFLEEQDEYEEDYYPTPECIFSSGYDNYPTVSNKKIFYYDAENVPDSILKTYCAFRFDSLNDIIKFSAAAIEYTDDINSTAFKFESKYYLYIEEKERMSPNFIKLCNMALNFAAEQDDIIKDSFIEHLREMKSQDIIVDNTAISHFANFA